MQGNLKRLLLLILLLSGWMKVLYPADPPLADSLLADSTDLYYEDLTDLLSLKLYTLTKSNTLSVIHPPDGSVNLKPNGNTGLGLGVNYKFIGIALSFGVPSSQSSNEKYGKTNDFDLQVSFFGKRIGFDGYLQRV